MWSKEFETSIFNTKTKIEHASSSCFRSYYNGESFFVKSFVRNKDGENETIDEYRKRIERSERINEFFIRNGINGALPISFHNCYTHLYQDNIFVAYQWLDLTSLQHRSEDCYRVGKFLAKLHHIHYYSEGATEDATSIDEKNYTEMLSYIPSLALSRKAIDTLLFLAELGASNYKSLRRKRVLTHGDIHFGNIKQNDSGELVLLDWEHGGYYHPGVDLFDTALGLCGYLQHQTDPLLFDSVLRGYFELDNLLFEATEIPQIVRSMYYFESVYINNMLQTLASIPNNVIRITDHINKIFALKSYEKEFIRVFYKSFVDRFAKG